MADLMCGIAGALADVVPRMDDALRALAHRGPDGQGDLLLPGAWLGHRRLSIIDLSPAGQQPMTRAGCGTIVFNGEIYDFEAHRSRLAAEGIQFDTRSDTEVLLRGLAAEGVSFLSGLHGMYALAWIDASGTKLTLARDHAGMKPLYLWRGAGGLAFASEVRALAVLVKGLGGTVRSSALALGEFLRWGSVPEPGCVLEGAEMLPPDTAVVVEVATRRELSRAAIGTVKARSAGGDLPALVRQAVRKAVGRHLVSDTPVALFLSGGIDSGVLASELAEVAGARTTAISVVLGSRGTDDEESLVRTLASRLGMPLEVIAIDDWPSRLVGAIGAYDQPSVDGLNTFLIAGAARELGFKVALSGVGADEVFGGYDHLHQSMGWLASCPGVKVLGRPLAAVGAALDAPRLRRLGMLATAAGTGEPVQLAWRRLFPEEFVHRLAPLAPSGPSRSVERDPLLLEQSTYLRDTLLRDTDVMGMAQGVEIRAPFLDPEVLAVTRGIGTDAVLDRQKPAKWLLREGWKNTLEPARVQRRKSGFTLDVARWMRGDARAVLEDARQHLATTRWLEPRVLASSWAAMIGRLESPHPANWVPLMALVQLDQQLRRWGEPA